MTVLLYVHDQPPSNKVRSCDEGATRDIEGLTLCQRYGTVGRQGFPAARRGGQPSVRGISPRPRQGIIDKAVGTACRRSSATCGVSAVPALGQPMIATGFAGVRVRFLGLVATDRNGAVRRANQMKPDRPLRRVGAPLGQQKAAHRVDVRMCLEGKRESRPSQQTSAMSYWQLDHSWRGCDKGIGRALVAGLSYLHNAKDGRASTGGATPTIHGRRSEFEECCRSAVHLRRSVRGPVVCILTPLPGDAWRDVGVLLLFTHGGATMATQR